MLKFDTLVIGAGLSGCTIAQQSAERGKKVLLIEKRNHISGNCHDEYNEQGIFIQKYGPHIFHTDKTDVWNYLSQFTDWNLYKHEVRAFIDNEFIHLPFNLNSLYQVFSKKKAKELEKKLLENFTENSKIPILELQQTKDKLLKELSSFIYEKIFLNYTIKQWGTSPDKISPEISGRVPVILTKNNSYFQEKYQGIPKKGFTHMMKKMIDNSNITLMHQTDMKELIALDFTKNKILLHNKKFTGQVFYTGMIDELFSFRFGKLPYRAIKFQHEDVDKTRFQKYPVVNFPNDKEYTRITEFKLMTGQTLSNKTSILKEFPCTYNMKKNIHPAYPILTPQNQKLYQEYHNTSQNFKNLTLIGRLAEYKYYDMDKIIEKVLNTFKKA